MRLRDACLVSTLTLFVYNAILILLVPVWVNHWDIFAAQDSPYPPLLPWNIFRPALALQDALHGFIQATTPPFFRVMDLATAYWKSEVIYALAKNGIMDALDGHPGLTREQVAQQLSLNDHVVCEYMRAGAYMGLLKEESNAIYSLTSAGRLLRKDSRGSLRDFVLFLQEESQQAWRAAGTKSIHSGRSGFQEAHGAELWDYFQQHPQQFAQFDRAMQSSTPNTMQSILGDWAPANKTGVLCDIGGGLGTAVQLILEKHPKLSAIVLDLPEVAARANQQLKGDPRIIVVAGSFFDALPPALEQCDTFLFKFVLHDWPDEECVTILRNIRQIAKPNSELSLIEFVVGSSKSQRIELTKRLMSLNMLASSKFGARERTLEQFQKLVEEAGLGQTCGKDGRCNDGKLEEVPTRDIQSVLRLRL